MLNGVAHAQKTEQSGGGSPGASSRPTVLSETPAAKNTPLAQFSTPEQIAAHLTEPRPSAIAQPRAVRVFDAKFDGLMAASLGSTAVDIALVSSCINAHTCREANPLMAGGAMIPVGVGVAVFDNVIAYVARKRRVRPWYLPQAATIGWHAVGIVAGVRATHGKF